MLSRQQKEAVFLLQIGTFLEYFDLMLFVHMAVILNELFFPKVDPFTSSLLSAFAFCSTFVLKPFGALLFGYIGDKVGRKHTIIMTTMLMSLSCIIMATVPTYAQIGITASWVITICRGLQGMSSVGETIGAELYIAEMIKPPSRYPAVAFIGFAGVVGMVVALLVARVVIGLEINWRVIFVIGALIALIGSTARVKLRESPEFSDATRKMRIAIQNSQESGLSKASDLLSSLKIKTNAEVCKKTSFAYFAVCCGWPFCFYFSYVYCGGILKEQFGYTKEALINHNLILAACNLLGLFGFIWLTKMIHPLKILQAKLMIYLPFICIVPWLILSSHSVFMIFIIQFFGIVLGNSIIPAKGVFIMHFPIFKRFRYAGVLVAVSHAVLYIVTSFGLVFLVKYFTYYGILLISIPTTVCFLFGVRYFIKLEKEVGNYPLEGELQVRPKEEMFDEI